MHTNMPPEPTPASVASLAHTFAESLDSHQCALLLQPYSRQAAQNWSNLPQGYLGQRGRLGLQTGSLSQPQRTRLGTLLRAATGSGRGQGYDAIRQHLSADDYLHAHGAGSHYGRGNFFVAFLGEPTNDGSWQLQFGGHHLAISNTYDRGSLIGATPSFRGIEPLPTFIAGGYIHAPLSRKHAAMAALLHSLDAPQHRLARLPDRWPDLLLGPGDDDMFPDRAEGLPGQRLSGAQQHLLVTAIGEWVHDVDDASARQILHDYALQLDRTHLSFAGSTRLDRPGDYVRIDGP